MAVLLKLFPSVDGDALADARLKRPAISDNGGSDVLQSEASRVEQRDLASITPPRFRARHQLGEARLHLAMADSAPHQRMVQITDFSTLFEGIDDNGGTRK